MSGTDINAREMDVDLTKDLTAHCRVANLDELLIGHDAAKRLTRKRRICSHERDLSTGHRQERRARRQQPIVAVVTINRAGQALVASGELIAVLVLKLGWEIVIEVVREPKVASERPREYRQHPTTDTGGLTAGVRAGRRSFKAHRHTDIARHINLLRRTQIPGRTDRQRRSCH